ncbi:MAG: type II toxin-antitoxin system VapC family toxin [Terrimicrobiaceae bacterium]|nr:type II toxin-antitoxin system VapC family toxin [Terrimicrobiaceae bacterium]
MKIFWDTNIFIYLWERKAFVEEMNALQEFVDNGDHELATSTLTMAEVLVRPAKLGQEALVLEYREAFRSVEVIAFDEPAAVLFAELRAANPSLRPPDAIQLACAMHADCDLFLTNDERLSSVRHARTIEVKSLSAWNRDQK